MAEENGPDTSGHEEELAEALASEARALGEDDRWEEAFSMLIEGVEDHPESALVLCWAGIAAQRLGNDSEAYDLFRRALATEPTDPFILAAAGGGIATFDDPEAESALRLAALTAPDFAFARAAYGAYLSREGMIAEALGELEAARTLAPEDADVHADLAMTYLLAGRPDDGIPSLEEALSLRVEDGWLRSVYGLALIEARRPEEAAEQLHQAAGERPEDVEIQLLAALAASGEGWEDEAWNALARAEAAADASDSALIREVEEAIEAGREVAGHVLRDEFGPSLLRQRLLQRA
jgi:tetratricopeptide (TPR) repeat protein